MIQLSLIPTVPNSLKIERKIKKNVNVLKPLFTSNSDNWTTDKKLFNILNSLFHFNIDLSASFNNNKCEFYYSSIVYSLTPFLRDVWIKEFGGILAHSSLTAIWKGSCFLNPPYSEIELWAEKAYKSSIENNALIAFLIPARVDTKYFQDFCFKSQYIVYLRGRQKFGKGREGGRGSAPFPSCLVLFGANEHLMNKHVMFELSKLGQVTENLQIKETIKRNIIRNAKDLK